MAQVLSDGTNTYLYGLGRICEEQPGGWLYHLGDALGSVRQLTDATGEVQLARSYEPYGDPLSTVGDASSIYQFTGEMRDASGLTHLRSRYLDTNVGRFTTKDIWPGDYREPLSLNGWLYVEANPIIFVDSTGRIKEKPPSEAKNAIQIIDKLYQTYAVEIPKDFGYVNIQIPAGNANTRTVTWTCAQVWNEGAWKEVKELEWIRDAIKKMATAMGGPTKFKSAMQRNVRISRWAIPAKFTINGKEYKGPFRGFAPPESLHIGDIVMPDSFFSDDLYAKYSTVHELAHVWDRRSGLSLSKGISAAAGAQWKCVYYPRAYCYYDLGVNRGNEPPPGRPDQYNYAGTNAMEDWAESLATYVYDHYYGQYPKYWRLGPIRRKYVRDAIKSIP